MKWYHVDETALSHALALVCLSNLGDCQSNLLGCLWQPIVEGVPRFQSAPRYRLIGSWSLRQQLLKYASTFFQGRVS